MCRIYMILCIAFLSGELHAWKLTKTENTLRLPVEKGVAAAFSGIFRDVLMVCGGCNFPDVPASQGGKKVYHDFIFQYNFKTKEWKRTGTLPAPMAYGVCISSEYGLILMGGMNDKGSVGKTYLLSRTEDKSYMTELPELEISADNLCGAASGSKIYVTGGNQTGEGTHLYMLDMEAADKGWKKLSDYPGKKRVQPVMCATDSSLFLAGGFFMDSVHNECIMETSVLRYDIQTDTWHEETAFPQEMTTGVTGGMAFIHDNRLYVLGGVNPHIFKKAMQGEYENYLSHSPDWYKFNKNVFVYDFSSKTWEMQEDLPGSNRAGASVLLHQNKLYIVCGEICPGIRTSVISEYEIK